ncbi:hypothetical protein OGAPHI_001947 [Ogataea philodendri]|uniref:Uncharacterized protein n=1 Tax=Ogataea philodendri TaxID=1378263 RepID=A0A9P8T6K2_9ASCO|nr:uncharacterized protein OGAPHI_001947 [Ogataea philodendri]KAH3668193.1 hypothetical protein OGAPHI_001947 [Ogataea philodendri]
MSLSILLRTKTGLSLSTQACLKTVTVCEQTPSTTSTRTTAPSHNLEAVLTSEEKSMWPGESIKLIKYSLTIEVSWAREIVLKYSEIADDSMVIPLSCSSGLESRYRTLPANL